MAARQNSIMEKLNYLKKVPFFAEFKKADLKLLSKITKIARYKTGEIIFDEDKPGDKLYIVSRGRVKIFACSRGRKKTLAYLEKNEFFGEMSLLDMGLRSASSLALVECELLVIGKKDFKELLFKYPRISFQVMKTLSKRLRKADQEIESLTFANVLGRIASMLVDFCAKYGEPVSSGTKIKMPLSHKEIAELTGTGREMVSRVLNRFRRLDCIAFSGRHIIVMKPDKLRGWI
jgi:CRP/FNR family transcriptional regulator, cyclic AMP receptor protein